MLRQSCAAAAMLLGLTASVSADTLTLMPVKDNTLFSMETTSNGAGTAVFSGRTGAGGGGTRQRAVLVFDVAAELPPGATITGATLELYLIDTSSGAQTHTLHRLLADWGEGTSSSGGGQGGPAMLGDATWLCTFFPDEFWNNAGGDFDSTVSASATAGSSSAFYIWGPAPQLTADVQNMLDHPGSNFGWLVMGNEMQLTTSKKFASRENQDSLRPRLVIEFNPPNTCPADFNGDSMVDAADLAQLLGMWGPCDGCPADFDGDGTINASDLATLLDAWGPCP
jgi:hypothetical protein